ncbi:hypothetical protein KFU94_58745 [Chloroflexi bacterium TSY]|nr:hypothetical protein [Chloroflexi bacterium TSY]
MAILTKHEIKEALKLLGELAEQQGDHIELLLIGGAIMVLAYDERQSTQDVDVLILFPREVHRIRELIKQVASKRNLPEDWLNDGAMGYLVGLSQGPVIYSAPGIIVRSPAVAQLLTMKLSAWRDDVDIADARRLLQELPGGQDQVWESVEPYLVPGDELKAQYAFLDLWETVRGTD